MFTYHKYRKSIDSTISLDEHGNPIVEGEQSDNYRAHPLGASLTPDDSEGSHHALSTLRLRDPGYRVRVHSSLTLVLFLQSRDELSLIVNLTVGRLIIRFLTPVVTPLFRPELPFFLTSY